MVIAEVKHLHYIYTLPIQVFFLVHNNHYIIAGCIYLRSLFVLLVIATYQGRVSDLKSLEDHRVLVLTVGLLLNLLESHTLSLADICLLILDNAHLTTKKHPNTALMMKLHSLPAHTPRPKVLGLMSTPGIELDRTLKHLLDLMANTGCALLTPTRHAAELNELIRGPQLSVLSVLPRGDVEAFQQRLHDLMPGMVRLFLFIYSFSTCIVFGFVFLMYFVICAMNGHVL